MILKLVRSIAFVSLTFSALLSISKSVVAAEPVRVIHESAIDCTSPCERTAVVFIHGITGSKDTWAGKSGEVYWPSLLATDPTLADQLDVYRVDYDSFLFKEGPSIVDLLESLQPQLDKILFEKKYSKVVLIGHSLGGVIARTYLLHVKARFGHRALGAFRLNITLGTPELGSDLAKIGMLASSNQQLRVLLPVRVNDFAQLLNLTLREVYSKHQEVFCPQIFNLAAFEKLPVPGVGLIVSEESATSSSRYSKGFERNHITLAKPNNRNDEVYSWVHENISSCLKPVDRKNILEGSCNFPLMLCGSMPDGQGDAKLEPVPKLRSLISSPQMKNKK